MPFVMRDYKFQLIVYIYTYTDTEYFFVEVNKNNNILVASGKSLLLFLTLRFVVERFIGVILEIICT